MPNFEEVRRGSAPQRRQDAETRAPSTARGRPPRPGSSFAARFGRVILQHGIAAIPSALLHYQGDLQLSAQQVWLVSYVLSHKWDEDLPYPSLKKMARRVPLSLSQLQRIKNSLCDMGYLKVYARYDEKRGQSTNAYDFAGLFHRIEALLSNGEPAPNPIRAEGEGADVVELAEIDPSFAARYGRVIARHGVAAVPRAIFTHQAELGITAQQVWFITYIFSFQWDTALPYPSIRRMAQQTGYSSVQLHNIKSELVEKGYLRLVKRISEEGGQDTNAYDFSGLLEKIRSLLQPEQLPGGRDHGPSTISGPAADTPETAIVLPRRRGRRAQPAAQPQPAPRSHSAQPAGRDHKQITGRDSARLAEGGRIQLTPTHSKRLAKGGSAELSGEDSAKLPARGSVQLSMWDAGELPVGGSEQLAAGDGAPLAKPVKRMKARGTSSPYAPGVAPSLHEEETVKAEADQKADSNHRSSRKEVERPRIEQSSTTYSPYIAAVITDFSHELNDIDHIISNVTQGLRIWQQSGLDEQSFTEVLYEARRTTRAYQGKQGLGTINNKMAYFFKVVRDLCRK